MLTSQISPAIVIGASVQAALYTATPRGLQDWRGNQYSFYFMGSCVAVAMLMVAIFIPRKNEGPDESPESLAVGRVVNGGA